MGQEGYGTVEGVGGSRSPRWWVLFRQSACIDDRRRTGAFCTDAHCNKACQEHSLGYIIPLASVFGSSAGFGMSVQPVLEPPLPPQHCVPQRRWVKEKLAMQTRRFWRWAHASWPKGPADQCAWCGGVVVNWLSM